MSWCYCVNKYTRTQPVHTTTQNKVVASESIVCWWPCNVCTPDILTSCDYSACQSVSLCQSVSGCVCLSVSGGLSVWKCLLSAAIGVNKNNYCRFSSSWILLKKRILVLSLLVLQIKIGCSPCYYLHSFTWTKVYYVVQKYIKTNT